MASLVDQVRTAREQKELFVWRFPEVDKKEVNELFVDFQKHDIGNKGELDEHEALRLLEHRGSTKTLHEFRELISAIDADKNKRISFIEWCCAIFGKSYDEINHFADEEARATALADAKAHADAAKALEEEIIRAREAEEKAAKDRTEAIERESKMGGVAGRKAFFARQAQETVDQTQSNEQKIKEEAAKRKAIKEAKLREQAAVEAAAKQKTPEEIAAELAQASVRAAEEAAAEAAAKAEEEKKARLARKAELNKKWSGKDAEAAAPAPAPTPQRRSSKWNITAGGSMLASPGGSLSSPGGSIDTALLSPGGSSEANVAGEAVVVTPASPSSSSPQTSPEKDAKVAAAVESSPASPVSAAAEGLPAGEVTVETPASPSSSSPQDSPEKDTKVVAVVESSPASPVSFAAEESPTHEASAEPSPAVEASPTAAGEEVSVAEALAQEETTPA